MFDFERKKKKATLNFKKKFSLCFQDSELNELRATIEALKRQSGLTNTDPVLSPSVGRRHTSPASGGKKQSRSS